MTDEGDRPKARDGRGGRGERTLTASEAAALIGVSVATVRGWADQGRLPSHRTVGGHRRFELEELREWLTDRGAPAPEPRRLRRPPQDVPPAPLLARELNLRTDAIVERVLEGYVPEVETPVTSSSAPAMRRLAVRFLRILTAGLETGRPGVSMGRAELAGLRGGLQGPAGLGLLAEHTRVAIAVAIEAEEARREGVAMEAQAIPSLYAMIDYAQAAVGRGFEQAHGAPDAPAGT